MKSHTLHIMNYNEPIMEGTYNPNTPLTKHYQYL